MSHSTTSHDTDLTGYFASFFLGRSEECFEESAICRVSRSNCSLEGLNAMIATGWAEDPGPTGIDTLSGMEFVRDNWPAFQRARLLAAQQIDVASLDKAESLSRTEPSLELDQQESSTDCRAICRFGDFVIAALGPKSRKMYEPYYVEVIETYVIDRHRAADRPWLRGWIWCCARVHLVAGATGSIRGAIWDRLVNTISEVLLRR